MERSSGKSSNVRRRYGRVIKGGRWQRVWYGSRMLARVIARKSSRRCSAVGRAGARAGLPADSPARGAWSAAIRRCTPHSRRVSPRSPLGTHRLRPAAAATRCLSRGSKNDGYPRSRPKPRSAMSTPTSSPSTVFPPPVRKGELILDAQVCSAMNSWACITGPMPVLSTYGPDNLITKEDVL